MEDYNKLDILHQWKTAVIIKHHFLHTTALQCRYFWQMLSIFFITAAVSMGFLAAGRHGRSRSFCSRWQIVIVETLRWFSGCLFFNSTTVIDGCEVTSCFKCLCVSDEVRLGVSEPNILVYSVPGGNNTGGTFTDKLPPLRLQYFCKEQLRPTQRLTQSEIMSLSSPGPHIECLTLILANQVFLKLMYSKRPNPNCKSNRRDKVALKTTCNRNVKFKIIKIRTGCQYVGYFHNRTNVNWAAQNLRLGRMRPRVGHTLARAITDLNIPSLTKSR